MGLDDLPRWLLLVALGVVTLAALAQALVVWWRQRSRRRKILERVTRAGAGEIWARAQLEALGFDILGAQVPTTYPVLIDQEEVTISLRADYLVEKDGRRYVVEVKTGSVAPRIDTAATRRQLLEYRVAFDVDGVLLLDAEAERIHSVTFPIRSLDARIAPSRAARYGIALVAAVLVAAVVARYS